MDKRERFQTAARGERADRPPVGCWIHFGSALWTPEETAGAHLRLYRDYDFDYLKVMHDYRVEMPGGLREVRGPEDLAGIGGEEVAYAGFDRQLETLALIAQEAPEAPLAETMFSPLQTVVRAVGSTVVPVFQTNPDLAHATLDRVSTRLCEFVDRLKAAGVEALFLSINGADFGADAMGITAAQFDDWVAPYDRRVLEAAEGMVRIVHVHGYDLNVPLTRDYPGEVYSWSSNQTAPAVADIAADPRWVPMSGLDEVRSLYWPPSLVEQNILQVRREAGDRLIVGPGCTVHSDEPPAVLQAMRRAVELPL